MSWLKEAPRRNPHGGFRLTGPDLPCPTMDRSAEFDVLRRQMTQRRLVLLETRQAEQGELSALHAQDRQLEYEEGAQVALADDVLTTLSESARREVMQIDAALRRLDEGKYGQCIDCGQEIPVERLRALPFTLRCQEDEEEREKSLRGNAPRPSL
jgi:DnaK suppressor protein